MNREIAKGLSPELPDVLESLLGEIESLEERIAGYERRIEQIAEEVYPVGWSLRLKTVCLLGGSLSWSPDRSNKRKRNPVVQFLRKSWQNWPTSLQSPDE
jgi:hypothetical protein